MIKKDVVIIGASGFGKEVLWLIEENNKKSEEWNVLGFIDSRQSLDDELINGYRIIGDDDFLINYNKPLNVIIGIGSALIRKKLYEKLLNNKNLIFPNIISSDAVLSDKISMGVGCIICSNTIVTVDIILGDFVTVNLDTTIGHDTTIKSYVTIYPSVNVSGNVVINSETEIGTGSCIIQGLSIGENTTIGAGAVVIRDIPGHCTAVGNPAKVIKFKETKNN